MELEISLCYSTMQNTEGGRKLNQAMASTGRAVATTGKAVGKIARFYFFYYLLVKLLIKFIYLGQRMYI